MVRRRRASLALSLAFLSLLATPSLSFANDGANDGAKRRELQPFIAGTPWADASLIVVSGTMAALGQFVLEPPTDARAPFGRRGHVQENDAAGMASNVTSGVAVVGSVAASFWLEHRAGRRGVALVRAPLILGESMLLTLGTVAMLKNALGECRPRSYDDATSQCVGADAGAPVVDDRRSWPSLHTAPPFAVVGATLALALFPSKHDMRWVAVAGAVAVIGILTGALRVVAGAHTTTDVTSGALLGLGLGLATGAMHLHRIPSVDVRVVANARTVGLSLDGRF